jgi:hypothetical protein
VEIKSMRSWPRGQLTAAMLALVAVLASGCGTADHARGDRTAPAPPKGAPTFQPDTRQSAALGTVRQLDPCALIDVAAARVVGGGDPAHLARKAPHACSAYTGGVQIDMTYNALSHGQRYAAKPIVIDGHKAYQQATAGGITGCVLTVPVSFELALQYEAMWQLDEPADPCTRLAPIVPAGLARLPQTLSAPMNATAVPGSEWDACTVLRTAQPPNSTLSFGAIAISPFVDTVDGCTATLTGEARQLEFASMYDTMYAAVPPPNGATYTQIDNHHIQINSNQWGCTMSWSEGSGTTAVLRSVRDDTCPNATQATTQILAALHGTPTTAPVTALSFFAPDEPDEPILGTCVDWNNQGTTDGCLNYLPPTPPGSGQALLTAAEADPNVTCLASQDAVRTLFGPDLHPIIFGGFCHFLAPDHTADIQIAFNASFAPDQYNLRQEDHRSPITVAEHPAFAAHHEYGSLGLMEWEIFASPGKDTSQPGYLSVDVRLMPPRGVAIISDHPPIDTSRSNLVVPLADALLRRYFPATS